jgi:hypothetical protein
MNRETGNRSFPMCSIVFHCILSFPIQDTLKRDKRKGKRAKEKVKSKHLINVVLI